MLPLRRQFGGHWRQLTADDPPPFGRCDARQGRQQCPRGGSIRQDKWDSEAQVFFGRKVGRVSAIQGIKAPRIVEFPVDARIKVLRGVLFDQVFEFHK